MTPRSAAATTLAILGTVAGAEAGTRERSTTPCPAPPYYAFDLVPTGRVPGTAPARGQVEVRFAASPYGVSLTDDGSYLLDLTLLLDRLPAPPRGAFVAWVTTTQVDRVERLGAVRDGRVRGQARWNKFLVVVTLEAADDPAATSWAGPIVLRGMSRSGMMHTMAGHGPFQQENCAAYGYD